MVVPGLHRLRCKTNMGAVTGQLYRTLLWRRTILLVSRQCAHLLIQSIVSWWQRGQKNHIRMQKSVLFKPKWPPIGLPWKTSKMRRRKAAGTIMRRREWPD